MARVLLLEDNAIDAHLIERVLLDDGIHAEFFVAENRAEYLRQLDEHSVDLIISDSGVPWLTAIEALNISRKRLPHASFLIVSGGIDEHSAELAKRAGAIEWIQKSDLKKLPPLARLALDVSAQARSSALLQRENVELRLAHNSVYLLVEAIKELSQARTLNEVQGIVRSAARSIANADGATFVLRDHNDCFYVDEDAISPLWKGQRFPMTACISGWAMLNKKAAVIADIALDPRIPLGAYKSTFVKSLVMVPIRKEAPIGAIGTYWSDMHLPKAETVACIQALADSTSIALTNVELYGELEARVEQRTTQLREANQSLEQFSYFVSHDLRAPVRSIGAFAQLLEKELDGAVHAQTQRALTSIRTSADSMQAILDSLLTLAQSSDLSVEATTIDMYALAQEAMSMVLENESSLSRDPHIKDNLNIRIAELPTIQGSAVLLRQVWINLLANAVKFSSKRSQPQIVIGAINSQKEVCYFVHDNGAGFDMAQASQLFGAFQRLHSNQEYQGTGIGLAIAQKIMTRHGGRIWAESRPDAGATFYFAFPKYAR